MNELVLIAARTTLPAAIIAAAGERASLRFLEFFAANIRNPHTRRAYSRAVAEFMTWCEDNGVTSITGVQPLHVSAWIEQQTREHAAPTVKLRLAALRHLFDWLVTGQVMPANPAGSVRGPSHVVKAGKTPVLSPEEARALIDSVDITTPAGLRDRALIGLMVFSFARIGAALGMKVEDVFSQNRRLWVRLREKGGKAHTMPCHHNLETYIAAYIDGVGLADDSKGPLFRTIGRGTGLLTRTPLPQRNAYAMVGRRATAAGIATRLGNHSFRATGITAYLKNGARWRRRRRWRTMPAPARRNSMIAGAKNSASMKWRGSGCKHRRAKVGRRTGPSGRVELSKAPKPSVSELQEVVQSMINEANNWYVVSKRCLPDDPFGRLYIPCLVSYAFSIEIYLKLLMIVQGYLLNPSE